MLSYGPLNAFTVLAIAIAVGLSVLVRRMGLGARRRKVLEGEARAEDLAELTGLAASDVQDAFGPPGLDQVWRHITLADIKRARTKQGQLFAGGLLDAASLAGALLPFLVPHGLAQLGLVFAALIQAAAWLGTASKGS
jgi:hypothetical protein